MIEFEITLSNDGCALDSIRVEVEEGMDEDVSLREALLKMVVSNIFRAGDTISIRECR